MVTEREAFLPYRERVRVLVCDRRPEALRSFLEGEGHDVVAVYDAGESVRQIRFHWPDLAIVDREGIGLGVVRTI